MVAGLATAIFPFTMRNGGTFGVAVVLRKLLKFGGYVSSIFNWHFKEFGITKLILGL